MSRALLTRSASTSGSISASTGLAASSSDQASSSRSDSVAPAGLGYSATTRSAELERKKNAMSTGIRRRSHCAASSTKSSSRPRRGGEHKARERGGARGEQPQVVAARRLGVEQQRARAAHAHDAPVPEVDEVPVAGRHRRGAHVALLGGGGARAADGG